MTSPEKLGRTEGSPHYAPLRCPFPLVLTGWLACHQTTEIWWLSRSVVPTPPQPNWSTSAGCQFCKIALYNGDSLCLWGSSSSNQSTSFQPACWQEHSKGPSLVPFQLYTWLSASTVDLINVSFMCTIVCFSISSTSSNIDIFSYVYMQSDW